MRHTAAWINVFRPQFGKFAYLRVNLDTMARANMHNAALSLFLVTTLYEFLARPGMAHPLAGGKVQKVLPVARYRAFLKLPAFRAQVWIRSVERVIHQFVLAPEQRTGEEIHDTMCITRHKVDRAVLQVHGIQL